MSGERVRIGLVGCGAISELGHAAAFRALEADCRVVGVADIVADRRARLGDLLDVPEAHRYPDATALLSDGPTTDLVVVALPPAQSAEAVTETLAAGARVLTEKPMAAKPAEAWALARSAPRNRLGVVHNYRYRSDVRQAMAHLRAGRIGAPRFLRLERPDPGHFAGAGAEPDWRRTGSVSGCLLDNAYHWIYLAEELAGSAIVEVGAVLAPDDGTANDLALLTLTHARGALTSVQAAWCAADAAPVIEVHGSRGSLRLTGDCGECLSSVPAPAAESDREPAYLAMYRDVLAAVRADLPFGAPAARCAEVLEVLDAAVLAARTRRAVPLTARTGSAANDMDEQTGSA
ncbi:Gfo/Idh/MocA family protein [Actinokineospora fastidiosa]|uniref:Dehydrogenase n=1 Tax=Actinokineospora fastidiosa TaxID=1816 RepID=A0A918GNE5_9PSEU|nr:Gfo/Idh/MocA family oxidoreductase [Actinokineospora fastidiosa]GGS45049.1 hypothetical protein GCM10010171_44990 [Actinokineospora fastidiosa]